MKDSQLSIAIAGAGLAGSLLAWRLLEDGAANSGYSVSLFDKGQLSQPRSAAYTAAAMISPLSEVVVADRSIYNMGIHSLQLWPQWLDVLNHPSARINQQPIHYNNQGSLVVAHPSDESELEQFANDLAFHLGSDNTAQWLTGSDLRRYEPDLSSQFTRGLLLPGEAFLDNRQLLSSLHQRIIQLGGTIHEDADITFTPSGPQCSHSAFEREHYNLVVDCRGVGASESQAIRGVRGEVLWVQTPEVTLSHAVRLMHPRYKLYIVPKPNNSFIVGATEIESHDNSPVSVQSMMELCSALYTLNPAFAEARIIELDANLRPSYLDNMPHIHWQEDTQTASINGLYRHGYLLAPHLIDQFIHDLQQRYA